MEEEYPYYYEEDTETIEGCAEAILQAWGNSDSKQHGIAQDIWKMIRQTWSDPVIALAKKRATELKEERYGN